MATRLPAVSIEIIWQDGSGSRGASGCHRHSSEDVAAVQTAATSLCGYLNAVSDAAIVEYITKWRFHIADARPTSGTTKNYGALFIFSSAVPGEYVMYEVLGVPTSYIADGLIDITNADIAAIGENIITSGYCNPFGSVATALISVVPTFTA
jgi:hypothetical protein